LRIHWSGWLHALIIITIVIHWERDTRANLDEKTAPSITTLPEKEKDQKKRAVDLELRQNSNEKRRKRAAVIRETCANKAAVDENADPSALALLESQDKHRDEKKEKRRKRAAIILETCAKAAVDENADQIPPL
jgi:hypothetical protein